MSNTRICDMYITIRTYTGQEFKLQVSDADTIGVVKKQMKNCGHIPTSDFYLTLNGKELKDHEILSNVGIRSESSLLLVPKIRGGPVGLKKLLPPQLFELKKVLVKIRKDHCQNVSSKSRVMALLNIDRSGKYHVLKILKETDYVDKSPDERSYFNNIATNSDKPWPKLSVCDYNASMKMLNEEMKMKLKINELKRRLKEASEKRKKKKIFKEEGLEFWCDSGKIYNSASIDTEKYHGKYLLFTQALSYLPFITACGGRSKHLKKYKHFTFRFVRQVFPKAGSAVYPFIFTNEEQVDRFVLQKKNMDHRFLIIINKPEESMKAQQLQLFEQLKRKHLGKIMWFFKQKGLTFEQLQRVLQLLMDISRIPENTPEQNNIKTLAPESLDEAPSRPNSDKIKVKLEPHREYGVAESSKEGLNISQKPEIRNSFSGVPCYEPQCLELRNSKNCMNPAYKSQDEAPLEECSSPAYKQNLEHSISHDEFDETHSRDSQFSSPEYQGLNSFWTLADRSFKEDSFNDSGIITNVDTYLKGRTYEWLAELHGALVFDLRLSKSNKNFEETSVPISYEILAEIHDFARLKIAEQNPDPDNRNLSASTSYKALAELHGAILRELKWSFCEHNPKRKEEDHSFEYYCEALAEFYEAMSLTISKQILERSERNYSLGSDADISFEDSKSDIYEKEEEEPDDEKEVKRFKPNLENDFSTSSCEQHPQLYNNEIPAGISQEAFNEGLLKQFEQTLEGYKALRFTSSPQNPRNIFKIKNPFYLRGNNASGPISSSPLTQVPPTKSKENKKVNDKENESSDDVMSFSSSTSSSISSSQLEPLDFEECMMTVDTGIEDDSSVNVGTSHVAQLAPVIGKVKKMRCLFCKKRLNITNVYNCRCGNIYCAQHIHAESHKCNFDYRKRNETLSKFKSQRLGDKVKKS